jgi:DNA-binding CsgD family transcriptional regulator
MRGAPRVLEVAQHFFDAAMAPAEWTPALKSLADLLRADHVMIVAHETAGGQPLLAKSVGMDEGDFGRFLSPEAVCWMQPFRQAMPSGSVVTWSQLISDRQFARSEFYNEVVRPVNGFYAVAVQQESPALSTFVAVCRARRNRDFAASDTVSLQTFLPYLTTSLELQRRLRVAEQRCAGLASALDKVEGGLILTDAAARPVFLNLQAERTVAEADGLNIEAASLAAATPMATRRLREIIAAAAAAPAIAGRRLRLERRSQRPPLLLTVLPIAPPGAGSPSLCAPRVAIFIKELDAPAAIDRTALREAFGLTARESEVAALLAGGFDLDVIAARLRVGRSTVRSHLVHVFEKTNVHSQAALVALVHRVH